MIQLKNITLRRGNKVVLQEAQLTVHPGQRVGVVGKNGVGKSSLFGLLRAELHQDAGECALPAAWVIAHVAQETPALSSSALDYALDGDKELRQLEVALADAEARHDGEAIGHLHDEMARIDGYAAPARAARLLAGLGFSETAQQQPVASFSGGWRMRLNLAQALMCRSDLLLLDEPTNHLDLEAVLWLEDWLTRYPGTLLLISHDRDFLDTVTSHIAEVASGKITLYTGGYSDYERARAERLAREAALYSAQQKQIAHLENFIRRFKAKATKARQAQSRVKALERLERVACAQIDSPFSFEFRDPDSQPSPLVRLEGVSVGYGDTPLLQRLELSVEAGARVGLLGPNGVGKSTFIKLLAGELAALGGKVTRAKELRVGYFAQHQLETLREAESPLWHLNRIAPEVREQELRDFLGGFDFRGEMVSSPVGPMSGGEKARLALALIVWQRPNLLLLDEPTNHLDLDMRAALTLALQDYSGALVVVSHDRALIEATTDSFYVVGEGTVKVFEGDLEEYRQLRLEQDRARQQAQRQEQQADGSNTPVVDRKAQKRLEAEARQRLSAQRKPLEKQLAQYEKTLTALQAEKSTLDTLLADEAMYQPEQKTQLQQALKRQGEVSAALAEAEEQWLMVQMELEALS